MRADLVFVHGFTQTPASWEPVTSRMTTGSQLSPVPYAPDFVTTADELDVGPAEYVGYSMGGRLCLQLALDRPEAVERLVLVSASPGIADAADRATRRAADEQLAQSIERDGVDAFLERWVAQSLFATLPRDRARIAERRAGNTVESLTHQLRVLGQGAQPSNWDRLAGLAAPTLLIVGELDAKYVDIAHRMAAAIPDAHVEVIADAGHACHLERPDAVAHLIASW
ncbi:MAG: 2-succinyl-6-hydroxy-2,4-cyclohexadiene-carboxylate synthase [bacterium]